MNASDVTPVVDCHCHVLDPVRFPYQADTVYRPAGQEIGTAAQFHRVLDSNGVAYALLIGPNSGYEQDNRCMLDAIEKGSGRFRGIAVVRHDIDRDALADLQRRGVVGVAFNATFHGVDYYRDTAPLLRHLAALGLCVSLQVRHDQLIALAPLLDAAGVRVVVDHCGRPTPSEGLRQPGFERLLALARTGRFFVKLSGYVKFAASPYPYEDTRPYVDALLDAFTPDGCMWASDWPFLRAPERIDYGPLVALARRLMPDAALRRRVMFDTPCRLFGFGIDTMAA
ncbi:MAG: amidohydrolase family protein [Betaproteobacteria bacterium]